MRREHPRCHRGFARSDAISDFVDAQGWENGTPDLPGMVFSNDQPLGGKIAGKVHILFNYYNRGEWRYDQASGKYLRWIENFPDIESDQFEMIPLVDRVTGQQLGFSNLIIIRAEYTELAPTRHQIDIWGNDKGLPAYFFRDGQMVEGSWRTLNDTDPMQFFAKDGRSFALKPGTPGSSSLDSVPPSRRSLPVSGSCSSSSLTSNNSLPSLGNRISKWEQNIYVML